MKKKRIKQKEDKKNRPEARKQNPESNPGYSECFSAPLS